MSRSDSCRVETIISINQDGMTKTLVKNRFSNDIDRWGKMERSKWVSFIDFLFANGLITSRDGSVMERNSFDVNKIFTNEFLPC
jgi:hypothetical protein